jgi:hypothetical protein
METYEMGMQNISSKAFSSKNTSFPENFSKPNVEKDGLKPRRKH